MLPGRPGAAGAAGGGSLAVVDELERDVEVLASQQRLHRLQLVLLLREDAKLVTLRMDPHALRPLVSDDLGEPTGVVLRDSLLQADRHAELLARRPGVG